MRRNDKSWMDADGPFEPFLPAEDLEAEVAAAVEIRNRLVKIEQQVLAEYTAMAAYATIAKQDAEAVRTEARADLDRSQATVIGLMEKLRNEVGARLDALERRSGTDLSGEDVNRLVRVENQLANALGALQQCLQENQELRSQIIELQEQRMQEQGWLVSNGSTDALSLH